MRSNKNPECLDVAKSPIALRQLVSSCRKPSNAAHTALAYFYPILWQSSHTAWTTYHLLMLHESVHYSISFLTAASHFSLEEHQMLPSIGTAAPMCHISNCQCRCVSGACRLLPAIGGQ